MALPAKSRKKVSIPQKVLKRKRQSPRSGLFTLTSLIFLLIVTLLISFFYIQYEQDIRQRADQTHSFTFTAAGDYDINDKFRGNITRVAELNPAFTLALGDLSYDPNKEKEWCGAWKKKYKNIILITGNHDSGESHGGNINKYIKECPFPLLGLQGEYGKQYYFDYPEINPIARFILVSPGVTGAVHNKYTKNDEGYVFVKNAIDDAHERNIPWIIVAGHKNCITTRNTRCEIEQELLDLLIEEKVDLYLQGHGHLYERSKQLTCIQHDTFNSECINDADNALVKGEGKIVQIMGTGGHSLHDINKKDKDYEYFANLNDKTYGMGYFTLTPTQLRYRFERTGGEKFSDEYSITGEEPSVTPNLSGTPTPTVDPAVSVTPTVTEDDENSGNGHDKNHKNKNDKNDKDKDKKDKEKDKKDHDGGRDRRSLLERLRDLMQRNRN